MIPAWLVLLLALVAGARLYQVWPAMAAPRRQPPSRSGVPESATDTPDREPYATFAACRCSPRLTGATPWPRTGTLPVAEARARTTRKEWT